MKNKALTLSRRKMFEYMAKGVAGALTLPSLLPATARAQTATNNKKVVFVYAEAGATHRFMDMRPTWFSSQAGVDYNFKYWNQDTGLTKDNGSWEWSFTDSRLQQSEMSEVLAPLYNYRDKLTYLEGVSMTSTGADRHGDAHASNHLGAMCGVSSDYGYDGVKSHSSAPSIDQRINEFIKQSNPKHDSLNYRMNIGSSIFHEYLYYNADRTGGTNIQRLPVETNPQAAYDRVFAGLNGTSTLSVDQAKVFQLLTGEYTALAKKLSSADRSRIDTHRALLTDLQTSLGSVLSCSVQTRPTVGDPASVYGNPDLHAQAQAPLFDAFARLVAAGFSCGVSRVASIGMAGINPLVYGLPASTDIHHEYEHTTDPIAYYSLLKNNDPNLSKYLTLEHAMVNRNVWQMQRVKALLDVFAATPDSSGQGSLLDSTLIVYVNELSHGNHGSDHWPVTLLGKFDGAITPGRYIKYPQNVPNPYGRNYTPEFVGVSQTRLFISIMQAFGMNIDYLETPFLDGYSHSTGDVKNAVQLSGPLPRFKI